MEDKRHVMEEVEEPPVNRAQPPVTVVEEMPIPGSPSDTETTMAGTEEES